MTRIIFKFAREPDPDKFALEIICKNNFPQISFLFMPQPHIPARKSPETKLAWKQHCPETIL